MRKRFPLLVLAAAALALGACGTYRGLPGHGGGKRFDEEQRIVAACIRRAVADMDLDQLPKARIQVVVVGIAHQGAGVDRYPGPTTLSIGANDRTDSTTSTNQGAATPVPDGVWNAASRTLSETSSFGPWASLGLRVEHEYTSAQYAPWTDADLIYLDQVLRLRLLQLGVAPTDHEPELRLQVVVDVLGTNRSQDDWLVYSRDVLEASCELTWYAVAADGRTLANPPQRTGASATYSETGTLLCSGLRRDRTLARRVSPELALEPLPR